MSFRCPSKRCEASAERISHTDASQPAFYDSYAGSIGGSRMRQQPSVDLRRQAVLISAGAGERASSLSLHFAQEGTNAMPAGKKSNNDELEPLLRLLPQPVAESIRETEAEEKLVTFACACAERALAANGIHEPALDRALDLTRNARSMHEVWFGDVRAQVSKIVGQWDEEAFSMQEQSELGKRSRDEYLSAFRAARAATSVQSVLEHPAKFAAAESCYEALHAIRGLLDEDVILEIARRNLEDR